MKELQEIRKKNVQICGTVCKVYLYVHNWFIDTGSSLYLHRLLPPVLFNFLFTKCHFTCACLCVCVCVCVFVCVCDRERNSGSWREF